MLRRTNNRPYESQAFIKPTDVLKTQQLRSRLFEVNM